MTDSNPQFSVIWLDIGLPRTLELTQIRLKGGLQVDLTAREGDGQYRVTFPVLISFKLTDESFCQEFLQEVWYSSEKLSPLIEVESGSLCEWVSMQSSNTGAPRFRCFVLICADDVIEVVCRDEPLLEKMGT